jgi:hypothetical protein
MTQQFYQIRVKGHLDQQLWSNWLQGLTITHLENGKASFLVPSLIRQLCMVCFIS